MTRTQPLTADTSITVVHVVNGTTKTDRFETNRQASAQIRDGAGPVGHIQLYDAGGRLVREVIYGHAEKVERFIDAEESK